MIHSYAATYWALTTCLLLFSAQATRAQAPVIITVEPMGNARAAVRTNPVTVTFSQPLTAASAGALQVFSSQRGGRRTRATTPAVVSSNTLHFAPTNYAFQPGETVQYTVTQAAASTSAPLASPRVGQFTVAVGATGTGNFSGGSDPTVSAAPGCLAVGDVDGDGDLDLLAGASGITATVSIRVNDGMGTFSGSQDVSVGRGVRHVALGDVDGDGDLDLLTANIDGNSVSVRLNDGMGTFSGTQDVGVGQGAYHLAVGDVDGDGDLDLLSANASAGTVSVRLNDGTGTFSGSQSVSMPGSPYSVSVGDVDGDGDVDLLAAIFSSNSVSVRLNDGTGTFSGSQNVSVGAGPQSSMVSDVDGDGDLDLLAASRMTNTVSVRVNDGTGTFSGTQNVPVNSEPIMVTVGDVDGDGNLDLLTAHAVPTNTVSVRLNDGTGTFSGNRDVNLGTSSYNVALGDVDNDGDVDLLVDNINGNSVRVRLNTSTTLSATTSRLAVGLALFPNSAHSSVTLTGAARNTPVTLLDALGRILLTTTADATGTACLLLSTEVAAGVYMVRNGSQVRRLVIE